jgi:hypothetical protein
MWATLDAVAPDQASARPPKPGVAGSNPAGGTRNSGYLTSCLSASCLIYPISEANFIARFIAREIAARILFDGMVVRGAPAVMEDPTTEARRRPPARAAMVPCYGDRACQNDTLEPSFRLGRRSRSCPGLVDTGLSRGGVVLEVYGASMASAPLNALGVVERFDVIEQRAAQRRSGYQHQRRRLLDARQLLRQRRRRDFLSFFATLKRELAW